MLPAFLAVTKSLLQLWFWCTLSCHPLCMYIALEHGSSREAMSNSSSVAGSAEFFSLKYWRMALFMSFVRSVSSWAGVFSPGQWFFELNQGAKGLAHWFQNIHLFLLWCQVLGFLISFRDLSYGLLLALTIFFQMPIAPSTRVSLTLSVDKRTFSLWNFLTVVFTNSYSRPSE